MNRLSTAHHGFRSNDLGTSTRAAMSPTDVKPSQRLLRAATAERSDILRQREQLLAMRKKALAELAQVDAALTLLEEHERLLAHLVPTEPEAPVQQGNVPPAVANGAPASSLENGGSTSSSAGPPSDAHVLRGPAIRETAVTLLATHGMAEAVHYREWYTLLGTAGYVVAGKDPLAVFLTQISRSPVVRKTTQSGVYELDRGAPSRLRRALSHLQIQLRDLATDTSTGTDYCAVRARRDELLNGIRQAERALEEAERVLSPPGRTPESRQPGETVSVARTARAV